VTPAESIAAKRRRLPRLHAVTDDDVLAADGWLARARAVLGAAGPELALHLRGPRTGSRTLLALADALLPLARDVGATVLVNDRIDVALLTGLDGVHLGGRSLRPNQARPLLGSNAWIGASTHDEAEIGSALDDGADFVFLGTIHPSTSHPGKGGLGVQGLAAALGRTPSMPVIGIGGIGPGEAAGVVAAGAHGVAAVSGIWAAPDPETAVRQYLEGLGEREGEDLGSDGNDSNPAQRQGA